MSKRFVFIALIFGAITKKNDEVIYSR